MEKQNKFTILIPCKDRANFLKKTLQSCSLQDYENLEILVSDDGSRDGTKEVVEYFSRVDKRIKYITPYEGRTVGMSDNFEFALEHVKEGFVTVLGGDDALIPNGISKLNKLFNDTNSEIITWSNATYLYPNNSNPSGQVILKARYGFLENNLRIIRSSTYLRRQAKELNYVHDIEAPMVYVKSAVSINLINKVKKRSKNNRFYSCSVPDGYSGIVLAGEVDEYLFSDMPFAMHGVSKHSAGLNYMTESEESKKVLKSFIELASSQPMHEKLGSIPYTPVIPTMTADFLLTAKDLPGWSGNFGEICFKNLIDKVINSLKSDELPYGSLNRELYLLREIAKKNELEDYFYRKIMKTKRDARKPLIGNAISPKQIYLDGKDFELNDVVDAGFFIKNIYALSKNRKLRVYVKALKNSLSHKIRSYRTTRSFPDESEWSL